MIHILIKNHNIKYDLIELLKVFFPGKEIIEVNKEADYLGEGLLIISELVEKEGERFCKTQLFVDNLLIDENLEDISNIEVYGDTIKNTIKTGIKKSLYSLLISKTEAQISWGILTGIRPVKIVHDLLDKNIKEKEIIRVLTNEYRLNLEKAELMLNVSKKQRSYIYPIDSKKYSLYVGIPFCPTRCVYCSFPSMPLGRYKDYIDEYISKLIYEINGIGRLMKGKMIDTIYIGGGTPTSIPARALEKVIHAIYMNFNKEDIREFTVEAGRPDTISEDYLIMLNKNDINRISINPQSMNDKTLKTIGRKHKAEDIKKTFYMAKDIGFEVINMDLILGLPGEGMGDLINTLEEIKELDPENLTVHTLSIKRGSIFKDTIDQYPIQSQKEISAMIDRTVEYSKAMGFIPYYLYRQKQILGNFENVGYSKPDMECIYNILMMEEKQTIMGAGMGSVSKIYFPDENRIERVPNFKDLREYINRIDELLIRKEDILYNNTK